MKRKLSFLLKISLVIALVAFVGCQDRSNVMEPRTSLPGLGPLSLPGVTIDSAFFSVYVYDIELTAQTVNAHRITANWGENTVTWNSFASAYDPTLLGSFLAGGAGWYRIDVKSLVESWLDGVYPNYGIVFRQGQVPGTIYASSENSNAVIRPKLTICFTTAGGSDCVTIQRGFFGTVEDAYINEIEPDINFGWREFLSSGIIAENEKMSLFKFSMPTFPELASIGDFVWYDMNMNGIQDAGELGVPGVTVHLMDCAGNILATDVTDGNGYYLFDQLQPGNYNIRFILPAGYFFSPQNQGANDAVDSDADVTTGMAACTELTAGESDLTWDAGIYMSIPPGCTRTIGYWKTHDGSGPQEDVVTALLPIWLGTAGGAKSINVANTTISHNILSQDVYGSSSNGITKLYAQLLGAKLSGENGADLSDVAATIAAADAFLATHDWHDWGNNTLTRRQKGWVLDWHEMLDNYNNGLIGPFHCE